MGGWGPALRGVMRNSEDHLFFSFETGPTADEVGQIKYFNKNSQGWNEIASQVAPAGINQNLAHVMIQERYIMSYGIATKGNRKLYECYLDTENKASRACHPISVGGHELILPPGSANVGAAIELNGFSRAVWWTTPGQGASGGRFGYIYHTGTKWAGPYTQDLPQGYTTFGFLHGRFIWPGQFVAVGELMFGTPGSVQQRFDAALIKFRIGQPFEISLLKPVVGDQEKGVRIVSSGDLAYDSAGQQLHILARTSDLRNSYYKEKVAKIDDIPSGGYHAKAYIPDSFRARFHFGAEGQRLLWEPAAEPILRVLDLSKLDLTTNPRRIEPSLFWEVDPSFEIEVGLNGIFVENASYSSRPTKGIEAVVCGPAEGEDMILKSVSEN